MKHGAMSRTLALGAAAWAALSVAAAAHDAPSPLEALGGVTLTALDGSSITLVPREDGMTRVIVSPDGARMRMRFSYVAPDLGTVADAAQPDRILGVFRQSATGIEAKFADGHDERLAINDGGGLSMQIGAGTGTPSCMAWYPDGHHFSEADRRAALARYARHLGLKSDPYKDNRGDCFGGDDAGKSLSAAKTAAAPKNERTVFVRPSKVHPIDMPPALAAAAASADPDGGVAPAVTAAAITAEREATVGPSASSCLGVDSDGRHWGFRNTCSFPVQFSYCMKGGANPLTACGAGVVPGSVGPRGFSALTGDSSLSETDAEHQFRWVACRGGAGEVLAELDRTDPPSGRCIGGGRS